MLHGYICVVISETPRFVAADPHAIPRLLTPMPTRDAQPGGTIGADRQHMLRTLPMAVAGLKGQELPDAITQLDGLEYDV